jgi:hypothetical protein
MIGSFDDDHSNFATAAKRPNDARTPPAFVAGRWHAC